MNNNRLLPTTLPASRQSGFSLVELMVAMTIGLVLALGIVEVISLNKKSYRVLENTNFAQENARYAFDIIGQGLLMADHWGGVEPSEVTNNAVAGSGGCATAFVIPDPLTGITGFDGASVSPVACLGDYEPNTDVVVVRYAQPNFVPAGTTLVATKVYVRSAVGERAIIDEGSEIPNSGIADEPGHYTFPFQADVFYVRKCSDRGANNACDDSDDGGFPIPTLTRMTLQPDASYAQEALVEGVEQMQLEYGVDTDSDDFANYYDNATAITAAGVWDDVVSARMSILVRGAEADFGVGDIGVTGANKTYNLSADNPTFVPASSGFLRRHITSVLQVRNRSRG